MNKIIIGLITLSTCFGAESLQEQIAQMKIDLQAKFNIHSNTEIQRVNKVSSTKSQQTSTRDVGDLVGDWQMKEENTNAFITVSSDQNIQDFMTLMGMKEAEGSLTATTNEYETELKYIFDTSIMGDDDNDDDNDDDSTYSYGPRIGAYLTDLDPSSGGEVYFDNTDNEAVITFIEVPLFDNNDKTQTFQIQLIYETGEIILSFLDLSLSGEHTETAPGGLAIGVANGSGEYTGIDLSASPEIVSMNPIEGFSNDSQLDLENMKVTFTPGNANMFGYSVSTESITELPGTYSNEIPLQDDGFLEEYLSSDFTFYGETYSMIYINNDGNIGFEAGDEHCVCWFCDDGDGDCAAEYLAGQVGDVDNQDDVSEMLIMNMDLTDFFELTFEMDLNSIDIENPTILSVSSSREDDHIDVIAGVMFVESGIIQLMADSAETIAATSIDTLNSFLTITNLSLYDSTGAAVLTVNGSIGPGSIDLEAGVETPIDFFNEDGDGEREFYLSLYDDWSGMDVEVGYDDSSMSQYLDTSYFDWYAEAGSLFLYYDSETDDSDTMNLVYMINQDTLFTHTVFDPCEQDGYESYQECFSDIELPGFDELVDIENFRIGQEVIFTSIVLTAIEPKNGLFPKQFKLYTAYPNPFNPVTTIKFDVESGSNESILRIYDISGKNVATLINERLQNGSYEIQWDASSFASGVYFSELISGGKRDTQKMVLLK